MRPRSLRCLRAALDGEGFEAVKIVVSGGFDADKIRSFERAAVPADVYGVGSSLLRGTNDFTADIARVEGRPVAKVGRSEAWSNTQTNSSGTSTILRVFHSGGMVCHRLRHHIIIAGQQPGHDHRLTWCRTSTGEWKSKG